MPDQDSRLVQVLDRVATSGQAAARPSSPDQIRRLARRRTVRHRAVLGAAALGVIAMGSIRALSIGDTNRTIVGPAAEHTATTQPPDRTDVPDSALLTANDDAVRAALGNPEGTAPSLAKIPRLDPLCDVPYDDAAPGTLVTRSPQIVGRATNAIVLEFVSRYGSNQVAEAAVASAIGKIGRCSAAARLDGTMHELDVHDQALDTVEVWSGTFTGQGGDPAQENRHTAVLRKGSLVAYIRIDSLSADVSDEQASAIVQAAAQHLQSAT